jgi:hypothetical protein
MSISFCRLCLFSEDVYLTNLFDEDHDFPKEISEAFSIQVKSILFA